MSLPIIEATTAAEVDAARHLFIEYQKHLGLDLGFQGWQEEMRGLPGKYAPPRGVILLAQSQQEYAGCAAIRPLDDPGVCELKRLYVRSEFTGQGIGDALMRAATLRARALGYEKLRLDSLKRLEPAARLYARFPFYEIPPYNENAEPDVYYMEMVITPN